MSKSLTQHYESMADRIAELEKNLADAQDGLFLAIQNKEIAEREASAEHNEAYKEALIEVTGYREENDSLKAENDRLREALDRNVHQIRKVKYDDKGHRCSWRSAAEAMIVRSNEALGGSDE